MCFVGCSQSSCAPWDIRAAVECCSRSALLLHHVARLDDDKLMSTEDANVQEIVPTFFVQRRAAFAKFVHKAAKG